jgi:hypothetical protein
MMTQLALLTPQVASTPGGIRILGAALLALCACPLLYSPSAQARIVGGEMEVQNVKLEVVVKDGALINIANTGKAAMNIASNIGVSVRDVKQSVFITGNVVNKAEGAGRTSTTNIGVISCEGSSP